MFAFAEEADPYPALEVIFVQFGQNYQEPPAEDNPALPHEKNPNPKTVSYGLLSISTLVYAGMFIVMIVLAFAKGGLFSGIIAVGIGVYVYVALLGGMQEQLAWLKDLWGVK